MVVESDGLSSSKINCTVSDIIESVVNAIPADEPIDLSMKSNVPDKSNTPSTSKTTQSDSDTDIEDHYTQKREELKNASPDFTEGVGEYLEDARELLGLGRSSLVPPDNSTCWFNSWLWITIPTSYLKKTLMFPHAFDKTSLSVPRFYNRCADTMDEHHNNHIVALGFWNLLIIVAFGNGWVKGYSPTSLAIREVIIQFQAEILAMYTTLRENDIFFALDDSSLYQLTIPTGKVHRVAKDISIVSIQATSIGILAVTRDGYLYELAVKPCGEGFLHPITVIAEGVTGASFMETRNKPEDGNGVLILIYWRNFFAILRVYQQSYGYYYYDCVFEKEERKFPPMITMAASGKFIFASSLIRQEDPLESPTLRVYSLRSILDGMENYYEDIKLPENEVDNIKYCEGNIIVKTTTGMVFIYDGSNKNLKYLLTFPSYPVQLAFYSNTLIACFANGKIYTRTLRFTSSYCKDCSEYLVDTLKFKAEPQTVLICQHYFEGTMNERIN